MPKIWLDMMDGSLQRREAGTGVKGKAQGHRLSPRKGAHLGVGGRRRDRSGEVTRQIENREVLHRGHWC